MLTTDTTKAVTLTGAAPPASSLVFLTYNTDNLSGIIAAAEMVRATVSGSTLTLDRDMGGAAIDAAYEIVHLPLVTHHGVTMFAAGDTMKVEQVAGVTAANSVALSQTIALLGQSTGSTAYAGVDLDLLGESSATMTVGAGTVTLQRQSSNAAATIPWQTMDFIADCP
jgi:hypothetical protein